MGNTSLILKEAHTGAYTAPMAKGAAGDPHITEFSEESVGEAAEIDGPFAAISRQGLASQA